MGEGASLRLGARSPFRWLIRGFERVKRRRARLELVRAFVSRHLLRHGATQIAVANTVTGITVLLLTITRQSLFTGTPFVCGCRAPPTAVIELKKPPPMTTDPDGHVASAKPTVSAGIVTLGPTM